MTTLQTMIWRWWDKIVQPHTSITDREHRQRSRLLGALLFTAIVIGGLILAERLTLDLQLIFYADILGGVIGWFVGVGLFALNRAGHTNTAAIGFIAVFAVLGTFVAFGNSDPTFVTYALVAVILTGIFFSIRQVILVAFLILTAIAIQNFIVYESNDSIQLLWYSMIFSSALLITFIYHLNGLEQIRREELETANRKLRESEAKLERRVVERTAQLEAAKRETEAALAKALEADRIKSQFLASMSHELRTPLNSILSFTDLMEMGAFGEVNVEQASYLQKISFSGRHLLGLINDVLDISKIESGMMKLFIEDDFDIYSEIERARDAVEKLVGDKPVEIKVEVDANLPPLTVDKRRVRQILLNLLSNAAKFTEEGSITLGARHCDGEVTFSVVDTGPGIAPDSQHIIFEPFEQTETGIRHAGGTGLGLPISRRLVEAHGGHLWIESEVNIGSAFHFTLPVQTMLIPGETTLEVQ